MNNTTNAEDNATNTRNVDENSPENSIQKERENGLVLADLTALIPGPIVFGISVFIVIVLLRRRRMRDVSNIMIANATISDAFSAVVLTMMEYVVTANHPAEHIQGICSSFAYFFFFQYIYSSWSAAWLAFERYDLIANNVGRRLTVKKTLVLILFTFIVSAVFPAMQAMGWDPIRFNKTIYGYSCRTFLPPDRFADKFYLPLLYLINYLVPLGIVIVSFSCVIRIVVRYVRSRKRRRAMRNNEEGGFSPLDVIRTRAFIIIVSLIVTNVVLTAPMVIMTLGSKFGGSQLYNVRVGREYSFNLATNLELFNKLFNSLLYLLWIKEYISCPCKRRTRSPKISCRNKDERSRKSLTSTSKYVV